MTGFSPENSIYLAIYDIYQVLQVVKAHSRYFDHARADYAFLSRSKQTYAVNTIDAPVFSVFFELVNQLTI